MSMSNPSSRSTFTARSSGSAIAIADAITLADTSIRRAIGLLRHSSLAPGAGLWIRPCSGVHTFGMSFTIDVVGLDKGMRIVRLWRRLRPNRLTAIVFSVRSVLELPTGTIDHCRLTLGDQLILE